ncbi:hypothetical protein [Psychromonas hadalis]|uniref:hypothetical protein n=1 Tax=Psychromonas hadalis TaxID=211669 RepID=UPI0003B7907C|nr:hypothetical protein [Psychromonas hadalis]
MKNNHPINNKQRHFKEGSNLVSVTDLNGAIEYVNDNFIDISGFSKEEQQQVSVEMNQNVLSINDQ